MRVRIKQHPKYEGMWVVETWHWWFPVWLEQEAITGEEDAMACAFRLRYPAIREVP